jgi:catechol 2,3-dioxygenase-like lactoylglutathione lyase family enzyme
MTIGFPDAIHHVALTVTDLAASRAWYRRLLGADPVVDKEVSALPGHHQGFHRAGFALAGGGVLALHAHPGSGRAARFEEQRPGLEVWAPRSWGRPQLRDASGRAAAGGGRRTRVTPWVGPARWSRPSRWSRWSGPSERHRRFP